MILCKPKPCSSIGYRATGNAGRPKSTTTEKNGRARALAKTTIDSPFLKYGNDVFLVMPFSGFDVTLSPWRWSSNTLGEQPIPQYAPDEASKHFTRLPLLQKKKKMHTYQTPVRSLVPLNKLSAVNFERARKAFRMPLLFLWGGHLVEVCKSVRACGRQKFIWNAKVCVVYTRRCTNNMLRCDNCILFKEPGLKKQNPNYNLHIKK